MVAKTIFLKKDGFSLCDIKTYYTVHLPGGSDGKTSASNAGDPRSIPGSGDPLEEDTAARSSTLAWRGPWTEEPGRLQSLGLHRVGHD